MTDNKATDNKLRGLGSVGIPDPGEAARKQALRAALDAFDEENSSPTQGSPSRQRPSSIATTLWSKLMEKKLVITPIAASLLALPIAGYVAWSIVGEQNYGKQNFGEPNVTGELAGRGERSDDKLIGSKEVDALSKSEYREEQEKKVRENTAQVPAANPVGGKQKGADPKADADRRLRVDGNRVENEAVMADEAFAGSNKAMSQIAPSSSASGVREKMIAPPVVDRPVVETPSRDRVEKFATNDIKRVAEEPVSTFSIDVDTASYSLVRRTLMEGHMPVRQSVRVEEMINYFPYNWKGPDSIETPFNSTITVMPTPWNEHTQLMHIGIKGYELGGDRPAANLVFLIDVSGSMSSSDKLPLLKNAFRMLLDRLDGSDTVSIVTYAGNAGTVLEPTKASEKGKILDAITHLQPGGSTAGAAGIEQAYHLAKQAFVKDGVNRVMLATDGDFNVGPASDEELKTMIEMQRESGIFLSVFGFGKGNYNDQLMQTLAQNGNGTAAYIDTLAEAQKTLVEEAGSTLFPIAKDVKIQVEFNPDRIAEYRLIGYETRALNREDFNNDRIDAGEIGSGHSVTAIYEITPKGSPAQRIDDLRYSAAEAAKDETNPSREMAFFKIRYKAPDGDSSKLLTTPVTDALAVDDIAKTSDDVRFSVAVAGFAQKLRDTDATANYTYGSILGLASAARGGDPFGYRAEFLQLVRLADSLDR